MTRVFLIFFAIAVGFFLWRSIASGTPLAIWIIAFLLVGGIVAAFTAPNLRRPLTLARGIREHTASPMVLSLALPGLTDIATHYGWTGSITPRLTPAAITVENHGLNVWLKPHAPAFTVPRHDVTLVGIAKSDAVDGQQMLVVQIRDVGSLMVEFGPWLAWAKRGRDSITPVALDGRGALITLNDYPQPD